MTNTFLGTLFYIYFWGGGANKSKNCFRPIFSAFQAIPNNFDFLIFVFLGTFFGEVGGLTNPKNIFDQFPRHFRQFWTTLIFFYFWQSLFHFSFLWGRGGGLKIKKINQPIFSLFQAILNNFDLFYFWQMFFRYPIFFCWG